MALKILADVCIGCGQCVPACLFGALEMREDVAVVLETCTLCGACVDVCPVEAIILEEEAAPVSETDLNSYKDVWVFGEQKHGVIAPVVYELLGKGRELADKRGSNLCAVVLGHQIEEAAEELLYYNTDSVIVVDAPELADFYDERYAKVLARLIQQRRPEIVLTGATTVGRSFIPKVAVAVSTGLTADCTGLEIEDEEGLLLQTRPAFGGNVMATIICPERRPQMATVRYKVMQAAEKTSEKRGTLEKVEPVADDLTAVAKILEFIVEEGERVNLEDSQIIVSGGRGLQDGTHFDLLRELAELLGAAIGASRGAVDAEWIPYPHQVGQTGKTVRPKLYIACGISGAVQHLAGMQTSDVIVAINKDPNAPIFEYATFGIVGDLFKVVPELIKTIKAKRGIK